AAGDHARHLHGVLVALAAVGGEEDPAALVPRRDLGEQGGELAADVVDERRRGVEELLGLALYRVDHRGVAVAEVDGAEARREVEVALAGLVVEVRPLAPRDRRGVDRRLLAPRGEHVLVGPGGGGRRHTHCLPRCAGAPARAMAWLAEYSNAGAAARPCRPGWRRARRDPFLPRGPAAVSPPAGGRRQAPAGPSRRRVSRPPGTPTWPWARAGACSAGRPAAPGSTPA